MMRNLTIAVVTAVLAAAALVAGAASADARGRLLVRSGEETVPLETAWVHVGVAIDETIARTTVTQVFVNHTDQDLEGTYEFPLPRDAAVADFAVWHEGRRVSAEVKEKEEAREAYDEAAAADRRPALVEGDREGRFRMDVFAIPAGGTKRIELVYTELVDYSAGVVSWTFPAAFRKETAGEVGLFDADVVLSAPDELAFVGSPSWPEAVVVRDPATDGRGARLSLTVEGGAPTRDLDVVFGVKATPFGTLSRSHRPSAKEPGYFQVGFAFNHDEHPDRRPAREVVFALDTSLSMAGAPLDRARRVVNEALAALPPTDRVNVVTFDAVLQQLFEGSVPASADNVDRATAFVKGLRAHRGSDFGLVVGALPALFPRRAGGSERVLVLLTDGQPTVGELDDAKLKEALAGSELGIDVVVVHLGYPARKALLEHLAPGATYHYVPEGMAGDAAVDEIAYTLTAPVMRDVTVRIEGGSVFAVHPTDPRTLFAGRRLLVHGRYTPNFLEAPAEVVVEATLHGERRTFRWLLPLPGETDGRNAGIAREWAKGEVRSLLRRIDTAEGEGRAALVAEVKTLGKEHRLVTPYTSFLARRPAELSLDRFKPGDPEIYIDAPADAARVLAILPWGEAIPCRFLPEQGRWMGRFLVPRGTADGLYRITVVVVSQAGDRREYPVFYLVDGTAPRMKLDLPALVKPGQRLTLRAIPVEHVFEGKGPKVTLRADVRRAVVRVGGATVRLRRSDDGATWEGTWVVPEGASGTLRATLVVTDWAANSFRTVRALKVR